MNIHSKSDEIEDEDKAGEDDPILARWAAEVADRLQAGQAPDLSAYTREHPERADQLRRLMPALAMMANLGSAADQGPSPGHDLGVVEGNLGEFRLLREVGRGGMGVVYEALEVPLGRRVALKVLPFAAALDPRQLKRFQLEAQAVASLNHRNIVPIFSVGRDRGIAYFAMQLIDGRTLADVNRELRQLDKPGALDKTIEVSEVTRSLLETRPLSERGEGVASTATPRQPDVPPPRSDRVSTPSTLPPTRGRAFFRAAADLGRQAAEALAHVHDLGIQHRDIKPANLLLDTQGHLWVTDFGLARLQGDGEQTRTGDVVGTLRYMSPEQALARPGMIDHRTDIYSLGATLYELITLRPPFGGDDRQDLLLKIVQEEPVPPRRRDPTIPIDLETIVTKAMAREPGRRYATAQELAEDLTRFLEGRSVLARRASPVDGAAKWVRRRWPLVATATVLSLLFLAISIAGLSWSNARLRTYIERLQHAVARADRNARAAAQQRQLAQERQQVADRHLYAAQIRLAEHALNQGQIERTQDILDSIKPGSDGTDPRHFAWHYLRRRATREIVLLRGHDEPVGRMTLSPDGRSLATMDRSRRLLLWDTTSGRLRAELADKNSVTGDPKFSADSRLLIATQAGAIGGKPAKENAYPVLVAWDAVTGRRLARSELYRRAGAFFEADWVGGGESLGILWLEPDSTFSASIWKRAPDLSRPQLRVEVKGLQGARFAPGGRVFSTWEHDRLQLRDVATGTIRHEWSGCNGPGMIWDFSPDGRLGVLSGPGHGVTIRDTQSGVEVARDRARTLRRPFDFSADGQTLVAEGEFGSGLVHLWDRATGQWNTLQPDHSGRPKTFSCALSADGTRLALACKDAAGGGGPVTLWDVPTRRLLKTFPGRPGVYITPVFAADGRSLFLACSSEICHWSLEPVDSETHRALAGHSDEGWTVAFSPDGRILASGSDDTDDPQTIKLWDVATGRILGGWKGHDATVSALAFSPDGRSLASVALYNEENVRIWDVATGRLRLSLDDHTESVRTVAYSPDGTLLATAGTDRAIRIWDSATGRLRRVLPGHTNPVHQVAFSPDGQVLASTGNDQTIRIWDVATGRQRVLLDVPTYVMALAFSPDGSLLATADGAGLITLWDPATGTSRGRIHCDAGELRVITFSPDGAMLAAAGDSRTIHLWDVITRQELLSLAGHQHQINDLAFAPDGMSLASCSHDGAVKIWDAGPRIVNHHVDGGDRFPAREPPAVNFDVPPTYFQISK